MKGPERFARAAPAPGDVRSSSIVIGGRISANPNLPTVATLADEVTPRIPAGFANTAKRNEDHLL